MSVIGLAQKMDAGEIYGVDKLKIDASETAGELHDRLAALGPSVVGGVLRDLERGDLKPLEQNHEDATKARKFKKADGTVDFGMEKRLVRARIHGLTPWPGCRVMWDCKETGKEGVLFVRRVSEDCGKEGARGRQVGEVIEGLRVVVGNGEAIQLVEVQAAGTKVMKAEDFAKGRKLGVGMYCDNWMRNRKKEMSYKNEKSEAKMLRFFIGR